MSGRVRLAAAIAAATFLLWSPSLSGSFLKDDFSNFVVNPAVRKGSWTAFFTDARSASADPELRDVYRPLTTAWYAARVRGLGLNPFFFHLFDVAAHSANAGLVCLIALELGAAAPAAAAGALLFSLHPAQAEAVSYASGAPAAYCLLLLLLTLLLHRRGRRWPALACFAAAGLVKETGLVFAPLLALADWALDASVSPREAARRAAPYLGVTAALAAARLAVLGGLGAAAPRSGSWAAQAAFAASGLALDVRAALWPYGQRVCYTLPQPAGWGLAAAGAAAVLLWAAAAAAALRRRDAWSLPVFWSAAALLTVCNVVPRAILAADRFAYAALPAAAWALALVLGRSRRAAWAACAAVLLWLTPLCVVQQWTFDSNFSADLAAYQAAPDDACGAALLATDYYNWRLPARAAALAEAGLARHPDRFCAARLERVRSLTRNRTKRS